MVRRETPSEAPPGKADQSVWAARWSKAQPWVALVLRLGLAAVALAAALPKLGDLRAFQRSVAAYEIFPMGINNLIGVAVPIVELVIAVVLVAGLLTRYAAAVFGLMMLVFIVGIAQAWARGLNIACGCFEIGGTLGPDEKAQYGIEIARDVGLALLAAVLMIWPASPASLDQRLRVDPVGFA